DEYQEVRVEIHDASNTKRLSYLATTKQGKRLYLSRTAVDADQLVVLTRRGYDPAHGYSGAECALYPALSDEPTMQEGWDRLTTKVPGGAAWPLQQQALEVAWLLGSPFLVQVIEGQGDQIVHCLGGPLQSSAEGQRLHDAYWRLEIDEPVDS